MRSHSPKSYSSWADFEREEIRPHTKAGWSLEDLYADATFKASEDDPFARSSELNFDDY